MVGLADFAGNRIGWFEGGVVVHSHSGSGLFQRGDSRGLWRQGLGELAVGDRPVVVVEAGVDGEGYGDGTHFGAEGGR